MDHVNLSQANPSQLNPSTWVDQYGDYLFRYANSRLRDANAAEEVVQETFLAGVRYSEQFSGKGSERGWLIGILKRKIIDFVRARNRRVKAEPYKDKDELDPSAQLFDAMGNWKPGAIHWSPGPGEKVELEELRGVVESCLKNIPKKHADVFVLSVMEELDSDQICKELNISPQNMWVRMHRARLGLAKCVASKWQVEGVEPNVR